MYFQMSTIQILEKCLVDNQIKSIHTLKNPSLVCVEHIYNLLLKILNNILNIDNFSKYPIKIISITTINRINKYIKEHHL